MKKTLIIGTTNPAKIAQLKDSLSSIDVLVTGFPPGTKLPEIAEDGKTVQENARKKAVAYAKAIGQTVFSMDNALFIDGLSPEKQPGIYVRRIGGVLAVSDEELLEHAISLIQSLGGTASGYWEFGVCIAHHNGTLFETTIRTSRFFTSKASQKKIPGYPLASIQIDPKSEKYISEMTTNERALFYQSTIGIPLCSFVKSVL